MIEIKFKYSNEPDNAFQNKETVIFSGKFNESKHDSLNNAIIELSDSITVFGRDFNWFLSGLNNGTGQIGFIIYYNSTLYAKGYFRLEQTEIDYSKRNIKIKPILKNITDAIKGWDKERKGDSFASFSMSPFFGNIESAETWRINDNLSLSEPSPPSGLGWGRVSVRYESGTRGDEPVTRVYVTWARQVSPTQFDTNWLFDSTIGMYVTPVTTGANLRTIAGARKVKEVIQSLLNSLAIDTGVYLCLESHFFQWNEQSLSNFNDAYNYANQYFYNLQMVQNSDAKRPNSYDRASGDAWKINLAQLISDLRLLFNVQCRIENNNLVTVLRVEHCSYFDENAIPLSQNAIFSKIVKQKQVEQQKFEKFQYAQGVYTSEFKPFIIENDGIYLEGEKISKLDLLSCDIGSFQNEGNAEKLDDSGFVILTCTNTNQLINENKPLAFGTLIEKLHKHNRIAKSGKINDIATAFYQKSMISTNDIIVKNSTLHAVNESIDTNFGIFQIESIERDIIKRVTRLKFG